MSKTGRNDPCPCGSAKKHKKCCLLVEQAASSAKVVAAVRREPVVRSAEPDVARVARAASRRAASRRPEGPRPARVSHDDPAADLVARIAEVSHLMRERRLDEAMAECTSLTEHHPDSHDGIELSGLVYEAMGDRVRGLEQRRRALAFVEHPDRRERVDPGVVADIRLDISYAIREARDAGVALPASLTDDDESSR